MLNPLAGLGALIALFALQIALLAGNGVAQVVSALLSLSDYLLARSGDLLAGGTMRNLGLAFFFVLASAIPASHIYLPPCKVNQLSPASVRGFTPGPFYRASPVPNGRQTTDDGRRVLSDEELRFTHHACATVVHRPSSVVC